MKKLFSSLRCCRRCFSSTLSFTRSLPRRSFATAPTRSAASEPVDPEFPEIKKEHLYPIRIDGFTLASVLANGIDMKGPILAFSNLALLYNVDQWDKITPESLELLTKVDPPVELAIFGCGSRPKRLPAAVQQYLKEQQINFEVLDSFNAAAVFNENNSYGNNMVAIIFPPESTGTGNINRFKDDWGDKANAKISRLQQSFTKAAPPPQTRFSSSSSSRPKAQSSAQRLEDEQRKKS
eukprot:TRINITY_DN3427_c0_g1_i1.p1 TRINITY_DN3427_c0_g1~~TRINITY_DN3427_c0_g1_i1.p1  ORF type:complete len:237 (-),score=54.45 TRINITY_DN3427_c0_g1_i1:421-1131(-)